MGLVILYLTVTLLVRILLTMSIYYIAMFLKRPTIAAVLFHEKQDISTISLK